MSAVTSASDRDPQRKALTDLIARFTADRDRVITAVQDCEARLEDLVGRLRGHDSHSAPDAPSVPSAGLDDLRAAMRELNDEMQTLRARETNASANTAVRALATESAQTREWVADLRAELPRLRADVERTATQLREATEEVRSTVTRIEAEVASSTSAGGAERVAVDSGEGVAELRAASARMDQRIDERTAELWGRVEARIEPISAEVQAATARGANAETAVQERLAADSGRLAALAAAVERLERRALERAHDASPEQAAVDATLHRMLDEQRRLHEEAATDIARTGGALTALAGRVGQLEVAAAPSPRSLLSGLYDEVWDALRARAEGILHELGAWLPSLPEALRLTGRRAHG